MENEATPALPTEQLQVQVQAREVVLVAGGTGDIGAGIVKALLLRNSIVVVPSRSQDQLDDLTRDVATISEEELASMNEEARECPIDTLEQTCLTEQRGHLLTVLEDVGDMHGASRIKALILERFGRLDRVIAALSRFWGKGVTTEQPLEEWHRALDTMVGVHFVCVKTFLPILKENNRGSYTFVTGRSGELCVKPEMGLMTVGVAALFGLVEAIKAEVKKHKGVTVNEVRIGLRVEKEDEGKQFRAFFGKHTSVTPLCIGRAVASIALSGCTRTDNPPYYLYSQQEVNEVLKTLW